MTPLEVLELPKGATEADIKRAFRRLAARYHPDRCIGDKDAEDKYKAVCDAYAKLRRPKQVDFSQILDELWKDLSI